MEGNEAHRGNGESDVEERALLTAGSPRPSFVRALNDIWSNNRDSILERE